ncbi:CWC16 protein [Camillea tinctor]|nr:CWC16 protein [Camillea tinctor]
MQGFNMGRYVPPDVEGTTTGNKLHNKHALGSRASKLRTHGALTVRFEMPFGVWCGTCTQPTLIGQGVRFNAEKRRVGAYHSTPILSFRMRHPACGGTIEIRTDPANTAYVVVEGGKRRDTGEDKDAETGMPMEIRTDAEHATLRASAFARLEKTIADRAALQAATHRIDALADASARRWEDPYARNRRLRDAFRVGRREREAEARGAEEIAERMGLGFEILPGTAEDARRAALVDFGEEEGKVGRSALAKPLFGGDADIRPDGGKTKSGKSTSSSSSKNKRLKSEMAAARSRDNLVSELVGNTRAAQDPFLAAFQSSPSSSSSSSRVIPGIKRRRQEPPAGEEKEQNTGDDGIRGEGPGKMGEETGERIETGPPPPLATAVSGSALLVEYDSD